MLTVFSAIIGAGCCLFVLISVFVNFNILFTLFY